MAIQIRELVAVFRARTTEFERGLNRALKQTERLRASWKQAASEINRSAQRIGVAVGGLTVSATRLAMHFGDKMTEIRNMLLDLSEREFKQLERGIRDLAVQYGRSADVIADGVFQMVSAGADWRTVLQDMRGLIPLVVAGHAEMGDALKLVGTILNAYNLSWNKSAYIADLVFKTNEKGVTTVAELAATMGAVVNVASNLDISLEELFGALASATKGARNTQDAVTQLRALLIALARGGEKLSAIFQKLGYASAEQAVRTNGLVKTVQMLYEATGGSTGALAQLLGRVEAVNGALNLAGPNARRTAESIQAMAEAGGTAGAALREAMQRPTERARQAWQALRDILLDVGQGALRDLATWLKANRESLLKLAQAVAELVKSVLHLAAQHPRLSAFLALLGAANMLGITRAVTSLGQALWHTGEQAVLLWQSLRKLVARLGAVRVAALGLKAGLVTLAIAGIVLLAQKIYNANAALEEFRQALERADRLDAEIDRRMRKRHQQVLLTADRLAPKEATEYLQARLAEAQRKLKGLAVQATLARKEFDRLNTTFKRAVGNKLLEAARRELQVAQRRLQLQKEFIDQLETTIQLKQQEAKAGRSLAGPPPGPQEPGRLNLLLTESEDEHREKIEKAIREAIVERRERQAGGFREVREFLGLKGLTSEDVRRFAEQFEGAGKQAIDQLAQGFAALGPTPSAEELDELALRFAETLERSREAQQKLEEAQRQTEERARTAQGALQTFADRLRELRAEGKLTTDRIHEFAQRAVDLARRFRDGTLSARDFARGMQELRKATDQAVEAAQRRREQELLEAKRRILLGQATQEDRDFLRQQVLQARQGLLTDRINAQFDALVQRLAGLSASMDPVIQRFREMPRALFRFGRALNRAIQPPKPLSAEKAAKLFGRLDAFLTSRRGMIAQLLAQISLLRQNLSVVPRYRQQAVLAERIQALTAQIRTLAATPPPVLVQATLTPDFLRDPGLQLARRQPQEQREPEPAPQVTVNFRSFVPPTPRDAQHIARGLELELHRLGRRV